MTTFRQFTKWYVDSLRDDEILDALETAGLRPAESGIDLKNMSPEKRRTILIRLWNHREAGIEISRSIEENRHTTAVQDVRGKGLEDIESHLEELLSSYGLQALAFALVVNPDEFKQNVGFRLIDEYGDRFAEFPGPPIRRKTKPVESRISIDDEPVPDLEVDPVDLIRKAIKAIRQGCIIDIETMDGQLNEFAQAWVNYKKDHQGKRETLSAIAAFLKPGFEEELRFQEVLDVVPIEVESYWNLPMEDLTSVTSILSDLDVLCKEARDLRMQEPSNMTERRILDEKLVHLNRRIIEKAKALGAFFEEASSPDLAHPSEADERTESTPVAVVSSSPSEEMPEISEPERQKSAERDVETTPVSTESQEATKATQTQDHDLPAAGLERGQLSDPDVVEQAVSSGDYGSKKEALLDTGSKEMWQAVAQGDFGIAYWLSKEQGSLSDDMLPDWSLLAWVLGSKADWSRGDAKLAWYEKVGMPHSKPIHEIMASAKVGPRPAAFMVLSAALRPAIFAPETAAYDWIKDAVSYLKSGDPLKSLMDIVFQFAHQGHPLNLGSMTDNGRDALLEDAAKAAETVNAWVSDASAARLMYPHTTRLLSHLASDNGPFTNVLRVVKSNVSSPDDVAKVTAMLDGQLKNRQSMEALIASTNQSLAHSGPRVPAIHSKALEQLLRRLENLKSILEDWVYATTHLGFSLEGYDWQMERSREFRNAFLQYWPEVNDDLGVLRLETGEDIDFQLLRERAIYSAAHTILGEFVSHTLSGDVSMKSKNEGVSSWQLEIGRPLWLLSLPPVDEDGCPLDGEFQPTEPFIDVVREDRGLEDAFKLHLENNDFMAASLILSEMERQGTDGVDLLAEESRTRLSEAQLVLKHRTAEIRRELEQATIDHVLSDDTRSLLDAKLLSIEEMETIRLTGAFAELEQIRQDLDRLRQERINSLRKWIDALNEELRAGDSIGLDETSAVAKYISLAYEALERGDIPLADEYLHYTEQAQAGRQIMIEGQAKPITAPVEFSRVLEKINQTLETGNNPRFLATQLAQGQSAGGLDMRTVPGARYREIKEGLQAWFQLKRTSRSGNRDSAIHAILTYIGFQDPEIRLVDTVTSTPVSCYYEAHMSAGNLSPLADFGSNRNGLYHVVVVYGRPSAETIGLALQHYRILSASPIILFMGRMPVRQRVEWSEYCRNHAITAMLIDELLMHFLAAQRESRLPAAISCGIAWGYLVPYQASGVIPPEIFKGRHSLVHDLASTNGRLIVYGGRQFGKSALLRMVQRQYHYPPQNVHVMYDDIRQIGHPESMLHPSDIWPGLRAWLISIGLLSSDVTEEPDRLVREIIKAMNAKEHRNWRVIMLLDEADNFLNEDAKADFPELGRIKSIMDQTDMRLKIILSGLHGVQRFYVHENHPFAQLREPIVVGPLDPQAARQLIIEPMSALGFDFSDSEQMTAVLRILCYTNYQPALIQGFCQELVKLVRLGNDSPPYRVTLSHVEAVYRRPEVRRQMQERFEWTLDLDNRYTAIVYCMVLDQIQDYDGYRREYFAHEILQLLREFWPAKFGGFEIDGTKTLLEELIGLGVLVRRPNGKYRLRNGNVARALGSVDEILERASKLGEKTALPDSARRQLRFSLDVGKGIRSPLTVEQISSLSQGRSGVALIFGNDALSINLVHDSLNAAVQVQAAAHVQMTYEKLPPECVSLEQLLHHLRVRIPKRKGRYLLYWAVDQIPKSDSLVEVVDEAMDMLTQVQGRNRSIRLVIALGPKNMPNWFLGDADTRLAVESRADTLIRINRWDSYMIERFYQDFDVKAPTQEIIEVTGGWPWLIYQLNLLVGEMRGGWDAGSLREATRRLQLMLRENQDSIRDRFVAALGVDEVPGARAILRLVQQWGNLRWEEMVYAVSHLHDGELDDWSKEKTVAVIGMLSRLGLLGITDGFLTIEPISVGAVVGHE